MAGRPARGRVVVAGGDPGDVRPVLRLAAGRRAASRSASSAPGRRERAGDDHLGRRVGRVALRVAGGHREAGRREERMRLVDAVVDHADLDPVARGRERRAPDLRRADHLRALVERRGGSGRSAAPRARRESPRSGRPRRPGRRRRDRSARAGSASECAAPGTAALDPGGDRCACSRSISALACGRSASGLPSSSATSSTGGPLGDRSASSLQTPPAAARARPRRGPEDPCSRQNRRYTVRPRGCGGIGRRARFRAVWGQPRGGSSPLIRIRETRGLFRAVRRFRGRPAPRRRGCPGSRAA